MFHNINSCARILVHCTNVRCNLSSINKWSARLSETLKKIGKSQHYEASCQMAFGEMPYQKNLILQKPKPHLIEILSIDLCRICNYIIFDLKFPDKSFLTESGNISADIFYNIESKTLLLCAQHKDKHYWANLPFFSRKCPSTNFRSRANGAGLFSLASSSGGT